MIKLLALCGPTAVGKTKIAMELCKAFNGEIISCDSMQIYRGMDIGSAKPSIEEQAMVKHHLIDICDPKDEFTVSDFSLLAQEKIKEVSEGGRLPVLCGGTGLYLNSIIYDMNFGAEADDDSRREELEKTASERGSVYMHQYLEALDPDAASRIHPNNVRKVIRAIEAYEYGRGIGDLSNLKFNNDYDFKFFALNMDRAWLYKRINERTLKLIHDGLVREVSELIARGYSIDLPSMKGIGYKEIVGYLYGECDLDTATQEIQKNTRHYAKRQLTWLKRYDFANWINIEKGESVGEIVDRIIDYKPE